MKALLVLREGWSFLRAFRDRSRWWTRWLIPLPPREYIFWRLGTVYGIYRKDQQPKTLRDYCKDMWNDRKQIYRFLLWRRTML